MADRRAELERKRKMLADLKAKKEIARDQRIPSRDPSRDRPITGLIEKRIETEDLLKSLGLGWYCIVIRLKFLFSLCRS